MFCITVNSEGVIPDSMKLVSLLQFKPCYATCQSLGETCVIDLKCMFIMFLVDY